MQLAVRQIAIPLEQVADGGEQATVAIDILKRHVLTPLRSAPLIGNRTVWHDAAKVVTPLCRGHFERCEEFLAAEGLQSRSAHALHQHGGQIVPAVRVGPCVSRRVIEGMLPAQDFENIRMRVFACGAWPAGNVFHLAPVAQAARVIEQMPHRDGTLIGGNLWKVFADVVVERDLPAFDQQQDRGRGELFADRSSFENRGRRVRDGMFQIRHAVRGGPGVAAGGFDSRRTAGRIRMLVGREDLCHLLRAGRLGKKCGAQGQDSGKYALHALNTNISGRNTPLPGVSLGPVCENFMFIRPVSKGLTDSAPRIRSHGW
jgi:hypothetical protein